MTGFTSGTLAHRIAHHPVGWFTPGVYPSCACGFTPRDNTKLAEHWRSLGFRWVDRGGILRAESRLTDNPILAAFREYAALENFGTVSSTIVMNALEDLQGFQIGYDGADVMDAGYATATPKQIDHARRVLAKLAALATKEQP